MVEVGPLEIQHMNGRIGLQIKDDKPPRCRCLHLHMQGAVRPGTTADQP